MGVPLTIAKLFRGGMGKCNGAPLFPVLRQHSQYFALESRFPQNLWPIIKMAYSSSATLTLSKDIFSTLELDDPIKYLFPFPIFLKTFHFLVH